MIYQRLSTKCLIQSRVNGGTKVSSREERIQEKLKAFTVNGSVSTLMKDYEVRLEIATALVDAEDLGFKGSRVITRPVGGNVMEFTGLLLSDGKGKGEHYYVEEYGSFEDIIKAVASKKESKCSV